MSMIYELIGKVMKEVGAIGKDSAATNYSGKTMYKFRGIDAVYNALNPVMAKYGVFVVPEVLEQTREERQSKTGDTTLIYSILKVKFSFCAPDGSFVEAVTIGEGMDSGDKASNKAMSIAMKYACFQVFLIPTEDLSDPDAEVHEVAPRKPVPKPAPRNENPKATVTTADKLPEPTDVKAFIKTQIGVLSQKLGITNKKDMVDKFETMRQSLIESGAIEDISANDMTMEQARDLFRAMYATFVQGDKK